MIRIIIYLMLFITSISAQSFIAARMGFDFRYTKSIKDYKNKFYARYDKTPSTFDNCFQYGIEYTFPLNNNYDLGIDVNSSNSFYSVNIAGFYNYELNYTVWAPSLVCYYKLLDEIYSLRLGLGIGYRYLTLEEISSITSNYNSNGFGALFRVLATSPIDNNLNIYISVEIKGDILGTPKYNNLNFDYKNNMDVNFNSISGTFNLGLSYFL